MTDTYYLIRRLRGGAVEYLLKGGAWSGDLFQGKSHVRGDAIQYTSQALALGVAARFPGAEILGYEAPEREVV